MYHQISKINSTKLGTKIERVASGELQLSGICGILVLERIMGMRIKLGCICALFLVHKVIKIPAFKRGIKFVGENFEKKKNSELNKR